MSEEESRFKQLSQRNHALMKELDDHNCQHLFNLASTRIKKLNQMLDRIIPENDSKMVLHEKKIHEIEVPEDDLRTYKIPVKDMESPVKIIFKYDVQKDKKLNTVKPTPRLRVFISQSNKEPKMGMCDANYTGPSKVLVHAP